MDITLHTEGWFDGAHKLENYNGPCANLHGHTWKVEVWIKGKQKQLEKSGILWDFGKLKKAISIFDHALLNDKIDISSSEMIAITLYNTFKAERKDLDFKVRIYEQIEPKLSWAEVGDF